MSKSGRIRAAQLLGTAALTTTAVLSGAGAAWAGSASTGPEPGPSPSVAPSSAQLTPLLADTGSRGTGLLVVYAGLLVAAGGGALWAVRRREEQAG
ncbi:hypothetical protein [Peterkaempfera griseoplana]|uniref:hypothetical protein n=1 Tax=Peterkaempfera griseoplana TaxID=66896 RepID=UPI0012FEA7DA|nr:hypothetical protein [Peterkaempfera griseoplana]